MKKLRTLLLSVVLIGISLPSVAQTAGPINPQDSLALVSIYNNAGGENWFNSWDLSQPARTWQGVDVDGQGRVNALSLAENNLVGSLGDATALSQLTSLQSLNIADNRINAIPSLPSPNIQSLDVSLNELTFTDLFPIVTQVGRTFTLFPQKPFGRTYRISATTGDPVSMTVEDERRQDNNYLWYKVDPNGGRQIVGRTITYRIAAVDPAKDSGRYEVEVRNPDFPNQVLTKKPNFIQVDPPGVRNESARDNTGQLRAVLRVDPDSVNNPGHIQRVQQRLESLGATRISGETCLCDEFSMWYFPDSLIDSDGEMHVGAASLINSACEEVEAVGGGEVQLGYDYLIEHDPLAAADNQLRIRLDTTVDKTGLTPVKVAVIDLGIDSSHSSLNRFLGGDDSKVTCLDDPMGYNFYSDSDNPFDVESSHGTHVSGIISSFIPDVPIELISIQVGKTGSDTRVFDLVCGIRYAAFQEADLINLSMGYSGPRSELLRDVIANLQNSTGLTQIIASAGNDGRSLVDTAFWPASFAPEFPNLVVAVGAMDAPYEARAGYSNYTDGVLRIAAPGTNIRSTVNGGGYGSMSGTSMSAPFITALGAYLKAKTPGPEALNIAKLAQDLFAENDGDLSGEVENNKKLKIVIEDCNTNPLANDDFYRVASGQGLTFDVRKNDCPDQNLSPSLIGSGVDASAGTLTVNPDGTMEFTASAGFTGTVTFQYEICSAGSVCSQASVNITVPATDTANYWWWIILILIIMIILAYFVFNRNP